MVPLRLCPHDRAIHVAILGRPLLSDVGIPGMVQSALSGGVLPGASLTGIMT